jgi:hypothetical protein
MYFRFMRESRTPPREIEIGSSGTITTPNPNRGEGHDNPLLSQQKSARFAFDRFISSLEKGGTGWWRTLGFIWADPEVWCLAALFCSLTIAEIFATPLKSRFRKRVFGLKKCLSDRDERKKGIRSSFLPISSMLFLWSTQISVSSITTFVGNWDLLVCLNTAVCEWEHASCLRIQRFNTSEVPFLHLAKFSSSIAKFSLSVWVIFVLKKYRK